MINISIVKEQYQQMPDEQLVRFAQNESQGLTLESFHLLKSELESRNIGLDIIEKIETDRSRVESTKIAEFERATAFEFTKTIWEFAFREKENGATNKELFISLTKKNINPEYAFMLISSIAPKSMQILESLENEIIVGWIFVLLGGLIAMFKINSPGPFLFWSLIILVAGIIRLATSYSKKAKFQKILQNSETEEDTDTMQQSLYQ